MKKLMLTLLCAIGSVVFIQASEFETPIGQPVIKRMTEEQDGGGLFTITVPGLLESQAYFPAEPGIADFTEDDSEVNFLYVALCIKPEALLGLIIERDLDYDFSQADERERYVQESLDEILEVRQVDVEGMENVKITSKQLDSFETSSGKTVWVYENEVSFPFGVLYIRNFHRIYVLPSFGVVTAMVTQLFPDMLTPNDPYPENAQRFLESLQFSF